MRDFKNFKEQFEIEYELDSFSTDYTCIQSTLKKIKKEITQKVKTKNKNNFSYKGL